MNRSSPPLRRSQPRPECSCSEIIIVLIICVIAITIYVKLNAPITDTNGEIVYYDTSEELLSKYNIYLHRKLKFGVYTEVGYESCLEVQVRSAKAKFNETVENYVSILESIFTTVKVDDENNPVISYTVYQVNTELNLTVAIRARIKRNHIRGKRLTITEVVRKQMDLMQRIKDLERPYNDEAGHLIASVLGGPNEAYNFFPQSTNQNRGIGSSWSALERELKKFLKKGNDRAVDWIVAVVYDLSSTNLRPYRPTAIELTVRGFKGDTLDWEAEDMHFTNKPNVTCVIKDDLPDDNKEL